MVTIKNNTVGTDMVREALEYISKAGLDQSKVETTHVLFDDGHYYIRVEFPAKYLMVSSNRLKIALDTAGYPDTWELTFRNRKAQYTFRFDAPEKA